MTTMPLPVLDDPTVTADPRGPGGLLALVEGVERALPLARLTVRTAIAGDVARTSVTQTFTNALESPVEAVHVFPLPEDGAVVAMVLEAGDVVVEAECKVREEAEQTFADARAAGHRAALLTAERADVHTLRVTNLPPGETVRVRIEVVERLQSVDGRVRWRFPTVLAPRYLPGQPIGHDGPGVLPDTDRAPDASRLQPPVRLAGGTPLDLEVHVAGPVTSLASVLHAVRMDLSDGDVRIAPAADATLDRDFVLEVGCADATVTTPRAWTDGTHTLIVVGPPALAVPAALPRDAVFVVDISGSMQGTKLDAARRALRTALRGLVPGDRFRLIAFDDRVEAQTPDLVPYDTQSLARAEAWIDRLRSRGGTEMLAPIQQALAGDTPEGRLRTVLFITDGQAWNTTELVAAVSHRRKQARFFTLGIDTAVNGALLGQLARVGRGTCELLTPSDDIEAAVARIEARFGSPILDEVRVEGMESASSLPGTVFSGRPASLMVQGSAAVLRVVGRGPDGPWSAEVTPRPAGLPLGALWAREKVATLEDRLAARPHEEEGLRGGIVELALEHHLATRYTAFVAVERSRVVEGEPVVVVQPVEKPAAWDMDVAPPPPVMQAAAPMPSAPGGPAGPWVAGGMPEAEHAPPARPSKKRSGGVFGAVRDLFVGAAAPEPALEAEERRRAPAPKGARKARELSRASRIEADEETLELADGLSTEEAPAAPKTTASDVAAELARTQGVDGSFGGDVRRTAAALLALILLGHTRLSGLRRRTVLKAATFLQGSSDPLAVRVLAMLAAVESGGGAGWDDTLDPLLAAGAEGHLLSEVRAAV